VQESPLIRRAITLMQKAKEQPLSHEARCTLSIELAGYMLSEAGATIKPGELVIQNRLSRMMLDPVGKLFTTYMTDQCFRSKDVHRIADQLNYLIKTLGIPNFLTFIKKIQLFAFKYFGQIFASVSIPLVKYDIRQEISSVIVPGEPLSLKKHIEQRHAEEIEVNLNHLGEAILGEEEAGRRLDTYLKDLKNPLVEYISIKISTICSQINLLGWDDTLKVLRERLTLLYRTAKSHYYSRKEGLKISKKPKFVNLDMEEYRDLHLTVELFRQVLDDPEFFHFSAGIVLQSYLPDSFIIQQELTNWAIERVAGGGAPIKIRIVKGANLAMELVEASMKNWSQAPYTTKSETDANFKRMLLYGCNPKHAQAVRLGIATHNLFDIAYALLLRTEHSIEDFISFEMLEGMADHIRRVVQKLSGNMLLYCPAASQEEFQNAVAYLVRRLDENTAPQNFLRHAFNMKPGTVEWDAQAEIFANACEMIPTVSYQSRRSQNRLQIPIEPYCPGSFKNIQDTDWTQSANRLWAEMILLEGLNQKIPAIPLVIGKMEITHTERMGEGEDPSFPGMRAYQYAIAGKNEMELALETARIGFSTWSQLPLQKRLSIMDNIVSELQKNRASLIGAIVANVGKTVAEADSEVSEAIDFASYYRHIRENIEHISGVELSPKGVVLVAPPWNFPCSISAGGILSALAAGNSVIFKPAPEAVFVGWQLANVLWNAGVSKEVLQFFLCLDEPVGSLLIQDSRIDVVIVTGATDTAKLMMRLRPGKELIAETGGKNTLIVSRMADRDLAIKDIIQSAFGFSGQKCSACSLVILEKEVYEDIHFRNQLRDATASMKVGSPWELSTRINPLIRPPHPKLLQALTTLDDGEEWLLQPLQDKDNPNLWSPGLKIGVTSGSFMHQHELFGPVLGIICANDIEDAIAIANATPYGLTGGIHTLDEREQKRWAEEIVVGNGYINRGITGAIVQRQPFGGCKESCFGYGYKAGGPNYLFQLMKAKETSFPTERAPIDGDLKRFSEQVNQSAWTNEECALWTASLESYSFYYRNYFSKRHDPSGILGQDNLLYYVPQFPQTLRIGPSDRMIDIFRIAAAAILVNAPLEISISPELISEFFCINHPSIQICEEEEDQLLARIATGKIRKIRFLKPATATFAIALADASCTIISEPVLANGRIELLHYLREVSLSIDYHRYGYLGARENGTVSQSM